MPAAITLTTDTPLLRVGVELAGFTPDGLVVVERVHPDGSRWPVRGMSVLSGGVAFAWDYEAPLSVPVRYEAMGVTSASTTLTVGASVATLSAPGLPSLNRVVVPHAKVTRQRQRAMTALLPVGRANPIVLSDALASPAFTLSLQTFTDDQAYDLETLVSLSPVMLLRMPGTRHTDWCYVAVSSLTESPTVFYKAAPGALAGAAGRLSGWLLECQVTDAPVGDVYGDPTSTWQALYDRNMTWQQLYDSGATWLDVLAGRY